MVLHHQRAHTLFGIAIVILLFVLFNYTGWRYWIHPTLDAGAVLESTMADDHPLIRPEVEVYSQSSDKKWFRDYNTCKDMGKWFFKGNFHRLAFETHVGSLSVFVQHQQHVATARAGKGTGYRADLLNAVILILRTQMNIAFVDICSGNGLLGLLVAKYGRRVLAVQTNVVDTIHICASVYHSGFQDNFVVVNTKPTKATEETVPIGNATRWPLNQTDQQIFFLGDIANLPVFPSYKYNFLKISAHILSNSSLHVRGVESFFQKSKVVCVLLETNNYRGKQVKSLVDFLENNHYEPFDASNIKLTRKQMLVSMEDIRTLFRKLNSSDRSQWPREVLWISSTHVFLPLELE